MKIFLEGNINIGKSTIINTFLTEYKGKIAGFKTVREQTALDDFFGIYLLDINDKKCSLTIENRAGDCFEDKSLFCYKDVFNIYGVELLNNYIDSDLIIMDELGILEDDCDLFKDAVIRCLDSDKNILGVIKNKSSEFLDGVRNRKDVQIIKVTHENRDIVLSELRQIFC